MRYDAAVTGILHLREGAFMDRTIRCTVCTWRGNASEAEVAPRSQRRSEIPPGMVEVQAAYAEIQQVKAMLGAHTNPPCPACGHHTTTPFRRPSNRPTAT
jgi:hypothetical protein